MKVLVTGHDGYIGSVMVPILQQATVDFITKPMDYPKLRSILKAAEGDIELRQTSRKLTSALEQGSGRGHHGGQHRSGRRPWNRVPVLRNSSAPAKQCVRSTTSFRV